MIYWVLCTLFLPLVKLHKTRFPVKLGRRRRRRLCWMLVEGGTEREREWRLAPFVVLHFDSVVVAGLLLIRENIIIEEPIFCDADNDKRRQRGRESDSQATIQPTDRSDTLIDACSNNST